jgi:hypothetical protein
MFYANHGFSICLHTNIIEFNVYILLFLLHNDNFNLC